MGKLVISKSLVERVAQSLHDRNDSSSSKLFPTDPNATVLAEAEKQAFEVLKRDQSGLLTFFLVYTLPLAGESKSVGLFLSEVILDAFRLAGWTVRRIDAVEFVSALQANRELKKKVATAHSKFADQYLWNERLKGQPDLLRYIVKVLCGKHHTCLHDLPPDNLGPLLMVLKSIVDVLNKDSEVNLEVN